MSNAFDVCLGRAIATSAIVTAVNNTRVNIVEPLSRIKKNGYRKLAQADFNGIQVTQNAPNDRLKI